jgi:hypothetical protein
VGRRALIIALASFLVIVVGSILVWVIVSSGAPSAAPDPEPTSSAATPTATPTPGTTPTVTPVPENPDDPRPAAVTQLAAQPEPHAVRLAWAAPADEDLAAVVVVRSADATPPADASAGTLLGTLPPTQDAFVDTSGGLPTGAQVSYGVFARDAVGSYSDAAVVTITVPAALTVTPVKIAGTVTQLEADGTLTDIGSIAFVAYHPVGTRVVTVIPASGVAGAITTTLTEPVGAAPGAVAWTYSVPNAAARSLGEGAKRDEVFAVVLHDGNDSVSTPVTVSVLGINDPPAASGLPGQTAIAGDAFTFPIPPGSFSDPDTTDVLVLSAGTLPAWLSFDPLTGFSGTPADAGVVTVTVTATDPLGSTASADAEIEVVSAENLPPAPVADEVAFDLGIDPLQTSADLLANDADADAGPNVLATLPASGEWLVNDEVAGTFTIDAAGTLHLDSGVAADGPLQRLGAGMQVTGVIPYSVTDGADTVASQVTVTAIGAPLGDDEYGVLKVFVLAEPAPARGHHRIG